MSNVSPPHSLVQIAITNIYCFLLKYQTMSHRFHNSIVGYKFVFELHYTSSILIAHKHIKAVVPVQNFQKVKSHLYFPTVCVKLITKFIDSIDESTKSSPSKIEDAFRKFCKSTKADDNRFVSFFSNYEM